MAFTWDKQPSSRWITTTTFNLSGTSSATAAFSTQTYQVRLATSGQAAWVKIGDGTPVCDSTSGFLVGANVVDYHTVTPGQKAAVVQAGSAGQISITEMS
jgi:hypothetical protein